MVSTFGGVGNYFLVVAAGFVCLFLLIFFIDFWDQIGAQRVASWRPLRRAATWAPAITLTVVVLDLRPQTLSDVLLALLAIVIVRLMLSAAWRRLRGRGATDVTAPATHNEGRLVLGARVQVAPNYHWAPRATGVVSLRPQRVAQLVPAWVDTARTFSSEKGDHTSYWVVFDEPQRYADGDGPIVAGEIGSEALSLLPGAAVRSSQPATVDDEVQLGYWKNTRTGLLVEFRAKSSMPEDKRQAR
jgi:hypothetical protein